MQTKENDKEYFDLEINFDRKTAQTCLFHAA